MNTPESLDYVMVQTTTDQRKVAERIAQALVEDRLAACVQIMGPITSIYRWQNEVQSSEEWLVVAKSHRELFARVEAVIRGLHNYEVAEILALPIVTGHSGYLEWMRQALLHVEPQLGSRPAEPYGQSLPGEVPAGRCSRFSSP